MNPRPRAMPGAPVRHDGPPRGHAQLLEQARQVADAVARDREGDRPGTARALVTVFDGGHIPTTVPRVFLAYPTEVDAEDREGAVPTFAPDTDQPMPVVVINQPAVAGDRLIAHAIAGRWVAEKGGTCQSQICVTACQPALPVAMATVNLIKDGKVVDTRQTSINGCCTFPHCGLYTVQVVVNGQVAVQQVYNLGEKTTFIALFFTTGLVCCGGYAIPTTLTLTDAVGPTTIAYDSADSARFGYSLWTGGHAAPGLPSSTVTTPNNTCVVAAPSNGPVRLCYQMICRNGARPAFSVQRSWSWVYRGAGAVDPIWYQDPSGFTPGQLCNTSPPFICGNPHLDTADFQANPSSSAPFVLSGTPLPAPANATPDPIGGLVVISA